MKNILLSALFALFVTGLSAQDYVVTFQPAAGNDAIDSIRATNLKTNISVKITGL